MICSSAFSIAPVIPFAPSVSTISAPYAASRFLLSMLIVLKQDNKEIADLLAIAPRSVLMLRHRFRQKIGMDAEKSLENFIEEILEAKNGSSKANEE